MNLIDPIDLGTVELQQQLYRYAHDLQDLLRQHSNLQHRHQMMLKALGRGDQDGDLLLNTLLEAASLYLITTLHGGIVFTSPAACKTLYGAQNTAHANTITQLMATQQVSATHELLKCFSAEKHKGAIHQRKLVLRCVNEGAEIRIFEALVILGDCRQADPLIYWFLSDETPVGTDTPNPRQTFPALQDCNEGLVITDPQGKICAVNTSFSKITGYSEASVLGENPRRLSSGLQDKEYYQTFWRELLNKGSWCGELFDRRACGAIYFTWMAIKAVVNGNDEVVHYMAAFLDKSPADDDLQQLSQLAFHDPLTGLPNKSLLEKRLTLAITRAREKASGLYVLLLDIHQLSVINDDMGRDTGDLVLQEVASRLRATARRDDTVARLGGDEFVIFLPNVDHRSVAEQVAADILKALSSPIYLGQHRLVVNANIGGAAFPQDAKDFAELLKCADAALFGAKRFGTQLCFYETGESSPSSQIE
jgi:diguanylate cyclase (GGDEF)-like protein/PAS domain S-box-containing protein